MKSKTRVLTAIALLPVFIAAVVLLEPKYFTIVLALAACGALAEFYIMYKVPKVMMLAGLALGALIVWSRYAGFFTEAIAISVLLLTTLRLFTCGAPEGALKDAGPAVFGLIYVTVLMSFQVPLREAGYEFILFLYACIWSSDAAAYYIGSSIGKHKLCVPISPNKTWEGAVGSVLGGTACAVVFKLLLIKQLPMDKALIIGLAIGVIAVFGDLAESLFKRDAGVKDSGTYLPGHGGLLDKVDGSLFVGPALYWMLSAFGIIGGFKLPF